MKHVEPWLTTPVGRVIRFLGSVQLAVPVLVFVAGAMAWGTYLESSQSSKVSRALVYGSWWFMGLMVLVCISLIFAVVVRFPWKKRHVGFITVHAGLVMLIVGGFWSLFGRVEGHLTLEEGDAGDAIELDQEVVELTRFAAGKGTPIASVEAPSGPETLNLGGTKLEVVERWPNTKEEELVTNTGPRPFRAINIMCDDASGWIGEESKSGGPSTVGDLTIRVMTEGLGWEPGPAPKADAPGYFFTVGADRIPLAAEGQEAFPGWRITAVKSFSHAVVSGSGLAESDPTQDNPAVDVTISDGKGTVERHVCFLNFPDMVIVKTLEGTGASNAKLGAVAPSAAAKETLVVFGPGDAPVIGYVGKNGAGRVVGPLGQLPATFNLGSHKITFLDHFTRAQSGSRYVKAPPATEHRPALVVRTSESAEPFVVPWKGSAPLPGGAGDTLVSFGPRSHPLPFSVKLTDFRKLDYPGTEMAMSYESDVSISQPGQPDVPFHIFMNNPYAQAPWKVYQSGFVGDKISVFSVMKDPGLPLTYIGSIVLCVGIFLTFYSRSLSWGHPGIPIAFSQKESTNVAPPAPSLPRADVAAAPARQPAHAGV